MERIRREFRDPPKAYRPMVRWFWPGGDVRNKELRREIRLLDEAGFGGAEIQPFRFGLDPKAPADVLRRVNDYLTPSFFGHIGSALREAAGRRMWIDYTFGSGWPFGGGLDITPELAAVELVPAHRAVAGPGRFQGPIPWPVQSPGFGPFISRLTGWQDVWPDGWPARFRARERLGAVVAVRGTEAVLDTTGRRDPIGRPIVEVRKTGALDLSSAIVLTDRVRPDRTLDWDVPEGDWQLFTLVQVPTDQRVLAGVGGTPQLVLDHFKRAALDAHIRAVGESAIRRLGRYAGGAFRGVFIDSLELEALLYWTDDFLAAFHRLRGYDLTPFLPLLTGAYDAPEVGDRIRHDHARTVSDLLIDNLYRPFAGWAGRHRLMARIQAHGAPADVLRIYGLSDSPETESLYAGGRYDFLKLAASGASAYGRKIVSSESFVWIGQEYQTTPEKIKRYADELFTAGVNQIVYAGFPYEYMDRPEPGWYPFVSPFPYASHVNHHDPFWEFLPPLNRYLTRLQYLSRMGAKVAPVALFRSELAYTGASLGAPVARIGAKLLEAGYDYDHVNEHALRGSRVRGGKLVSPGGAVHDRLVVIDEERMSLELVRRLDTFARAGLPILFVGRRPTAEIGYRDHEARTAEIVRLMGALTNGSARPVESVAGIDEAMAAMATATVPNVRFEGSSAGLSFIQKRIGSADVYFVRNGTPEERAIDLVLPGARGRPERWDPWTGTTAPIEEWTPTSAGPRLSLRLDPYGLNVFVFEPENRTPARAPRRAEPGSGRALPVGTGAERWSFRATGRDRQGGQELYVRSLDSLFDWSADPELRHFTGRGRYTIDFVLDSLDPARTQVELDLGAVRDVAEIRINDRQGPTLLLRPYRAEVTQLVRPGKNRLEVTVTNPLLNRLIGSGMTLGLVFGGAFGRAPDPLPAGLLGPVRLLIRPR